MHEDLVINAGAWIGSHLPESAAIALSVIALPVFLLTSRLVLRALHARGIGPLLWLRTRTPLGVVWMLLIARLNLRLLHEHTGPVPWLLIVLQLALIAGFTWLAMRIVQAGGEVVTLRRGGLELPDDPKLLDTNLQARGALTRARVLTRVVNLIVILIGVGLALMSIPGVRRIGTSLLASAGIAGVVVGFAARPVLSNLLAGLQIALTEPIRLNDVLIVQGEWGRVEEITGTYVVFRIWDDRRLILPLQWFIEHPFENWTRTSASLLATVFLWVDYTMPIEPIRAELKRLCAADPDWDERYALVHVTESDDHALQVRLLMSAANSARAWELRCRVREAMVAYLQREWPQHLPNRRLNWQPDEPFASPAGLRPGSGGAA
ncbi:miniconductance mechanosensitive channel MscM precursor [mine drainage metagenome]|jgi:small-conductance mechanosensitive channel|uniref:Miniconductance mechanosensitive channel MscM n=1 Tax=mine drainage metagenome TaxID=410659 RepID=A0A1J5R109_9ZZZZ